MTLKARVTLSKSPNSATLYLAIPASMVKDSQFPFDTSEPVDVEIKPDKDTIVISGIASQAQELLEELEQEE